jgi:hypothetical protein
MSSSGPFTARVHPFDSPTSHACAYELGLSSAQNAFVFMYVPPYRKLMVPCLFLKLQHVLGGFLSLLLHSPQTSVTDFQRVIVAASAMDLIQYRILGLLPKD